MVHVDSVQPNLSCINTAHVSVDLDPPASGPGAERILRALGKEHSFGSAVHFWN